MSTVEARRRGPVTVALLALLVPLAVVVMGAGTPAAADGQAVSAIDREFLVKVRQAGLWEIPTGQQAQQHASSAIVKDVGAHLVEDHTRLDAEVRAVAERLGVPLPSQASEDQQGWMAELSGKWGPEYDQAFADRLRAAHGKVFAFVAQVRAGTRNDEIRAFAQHTNGVVMKHMTLLESTGLVNYAALPEPVGTPPTSTAPSTGPSNPAVGQATSVAPVAVAAATRHGGDGDDDGGGVAPGLVALICVTEAGLTLGLLRLFRSR